MRLCALCELCGSCEAEMPKLKTHRGAAKRFKRTKNGKFLRGTAFKQHILTSKTRKRKRGAERHDDGRRRGCAEAGADAAVQISCSSGLSQADS